MRGFALPGAIFLLVVCGLLGALILRLVTGGSASASLDHVGARVYQAGQAGLERGLYEVIRNRNCPAGQTLDLTAYYSGIRIYWTCSQGSAFDEGSGVNRAIYTITSTACNDLTSTSCTPASLPAGYVERRFEAAADCPTSAAAACK
jgi:hypothetical protein